MTDSGERPEALRKIRRSVRGRSRAMTASSMDTVRLPLFFVLSLRRRFSGPERWRSMLEFE